MRGGDQLISGIHNSFIGGILNFNYREKLGKERLTMKFKLVCIVLLSLVILTGNCTANGLGGKSEIPVCISADNSLLLKTSTDHIGLVLVDAATGKELLVAKSKGAGHYASISPDNKYVCYKLIQENKDGKRFFVPMLFDIGKMKSIPLSSPSKNAGTPVVAKNGQIAFTVGNELIVLDGDFRKEVTLDLGHHVNLLAISPDGSYVAYNNRDEQIVLASLKMLGSEIVATDGDGSFWGPEFSPSGDNLLLSSVDGRILVHTLANGLTKMIGKGSNPSWVDDEKVAFTKKTDNGRVVQKTELCIVDVFGGKAGKILINESDAEVVVAGKSAVISKDGGLSIGKIVIDSGGAGIKLSGGNPGLGGLLVNGIESKSAAKIELDTKGTVYISGVPYLHQVYDVPEWFSGYWACGATSAAMTLAYYGCFWNWECWCMYPSSHYADHGPFIAETYTYDGFTFNIAELDQTEDEWATGGYGYITQNDWEDTKTHMAEYISYHGPTSSVDWSPTFAKSITESDNSYPYVILNSLTTSGHYIVGIGYYDDQYSLICNDPYGDKNTAGYPSYDGAGAVYDWPGYSYGNENLNTVHCYIYSRYSVQPTPTPEPTPIHVIVDNADVDCTKTGTWTDSTNVRGWYGTNYCWADINQNDTASFDLDVPQSDFYNIYVRYTSGTDRSYEAPFTVNHNGGSNTVDVEERYWGGRWRFIGNYYFTSGTGSVSLSSNTGEAGDTTIVVADAVKAEIGPTPTPQPEVYVYDITMSSSHTGQNYSGIATVWIKDDSGNNIEGATVYGDWSGAVSESDSGVTGADGKATITSSRKRGGGTFTFCVTDVDASGYVYNSSLNNETCDSITAP